MTLLEKDVKRMELQIEQLISIVASLNGRLNRFEEIERKKRMKETHQVSHAKRV